MRISAEAKQATRKRILEAAKLLFRSQGYDQTTTRDIAQQAGIATGTLFNYFPTKEAIVSCFAAEALSAAEVKFRSEYSEPYDLEQEIFRFVALGLRELRPYRKYLHPVLEGPLNPVSLPKTPEDPAQIRVDHLEQVGEIIVAHKGQLAAMALVLQIYWALYTGVLCFWVTDDSPKQEDTLALLDQSIQMLAGWLDTASVSALNFKGGE